MEGQLKFLLQTRSFVRFFLPIFHDDDFPTLHQLSKEGFIALTNHPRLALALQSIHDLDLVELRDSLGDGDDESDLSLDGFEDSIRGSGRRNVDDGGVGLGVLDGLWSVERKRKWEGGREGEGEGWVSSVSGGRGRDEMEGREGGAGREGNSECGLRGVYAASS